MGSRKPNDRQWWEVETQFIENEMLKKYPMGSSHSYCDMQAHFAEKDGFTDLAERIKKAKKDRENNYELR